jgi:hypothetical protein
MKRITGGTGILPDSYFDHFQGKSEVDAVEQNTATGFDFEPLSNGDVLIEFFADDGKTINTQVITREAVARLPVVVHAFFLAVEKGQGAALVFLNGVTVLEGHNDAR